MSRKVDNPGLEGHLKAGLSHQKRPQKASKSLFQETLQQKRGYAKGEIPPFPQRRVSPRNITQTQAKRLATYAPIIKNCAQKYNVPIELICGVILQESGGNYKARSHAGAQGLMQLMPATARRMGVLNSYNPAQNIEGGTKYLRFLLDRFRGNVELALAGYNAGEKNVEKYGMRIPPFRETQNYVPAVLGYSLSMIQVLRKTPPAATVAQATPNKNPT